MPDLPWAADRVLTSDLVRAIVSRQFPAFADSRVEYLDEGWDNVVFEVGSSWLFRFPKRPCVEPSLLVERALLGRIAPLLPIPVPRFEIFGEPSELFPRAFAGYRKLPGVAGYRVLPARVPRLAERLADFLVALHSFPVAEAAALGVPRKTGSRSLTRLRERVVERFPVFASAAPDLVARAEDFLGRPLPDEFQGESRLLHADLYGAHILVESDELTGVIDWADAEIGDPAVDLSGLLHWGGDPVFRAVLERYPFADAGLPDRARYTAVCLGFFDVFYGVGAARPECLEVGVRALELNLPR